MSDTAQSKLSQWMSRKPKAERLAPGGSVTIHSLQAGAAIPTVIEPEGNEIDLLLWAQDSLNLLARKQAEHEALLFRGFGVASIEHFEAFSQLFSSSLMDYTERSTPRREVTGKIYTSTEYPAHLPIPMHNELSYAHAWPERIFFFCLQPAEQGGETPIADSREVFRQIDSEVRERFLRDKVLYVRNYGGGLGLTWQEAFQTSDPAAVEDFCRGAGMEWRWKDGGRLTTRAVREAAIQHPRSGEMVWFNQAHLHHASSLPPEARESLASVVDSADLPFNTYYGDGSEIEPAALDSIREAYRRASVVFPWRQGDVLMLDNVSVAHGRSPYQGARRIVVAMA